MIDDYGLKSCITGALFKDQVRVPVAKFTFRSEKEAIEAGGLVHMLIGNHEEMNITGIAIDNPRYVTVEQFVSFLPDDFKEKKEKDCKRIGFWVIR